MRTKEIDAWLGTLLRTFPALTQVDDADFRLLYLDHDTNGMLISMKRQFGIAARIQLGLVPPESKGAKKPASVWLHISQGSPTAIYGSSEFLSTTKAVVFAKKQYIRTAGYDELVAALSFCMAQMLLHFLKHELRETQEAIELTAMLFGYADSFTSEVGIPEEKDSSFNLNLDMFKDLLRRNPLPEISGTLSGEEREYARKKIARMRR